MTRRHLPNTLPSFHPLAGATLTLTLTLALAGCGDDGAGTSDASAGTDTDATSTSAGPSTSGTGTGTSDPTVGPGTNSESDTDATTDPTDPSATDPSATDPSTTDPSTTDPSTTDPSTTDPSTTGSTGVETTGDLTVTDTDGTTGNGMVCVTDEDCEGQPGPVCEVISGICVECTPDNDPCPLSSYCDADAYVCVDGCLDDEDCGGNAYCVADNTCADTAESCLQWLEWGQDQDGMYQIDPDGDGPINAFMTFCDQTTDGGGWTEITLELACADVLGGNLVAVQPAPVEGIDAECRPYTQDTSGKHTYHYTFQWPPTYQEFYLHNYNLKANAAPGNYTSDIYPNNFVQTVWTVANAGAGWGDISFGTADEAGPTTSYASYLMANWSSNNEELPWPGMMDMYMIMAPSDTFRIGWGEAGGEHEGWYPWWSGTIRIR